MVTKATKRQQRYRERQQSSGLVQVRAWVPDRLEDTYKAIAIVMRAQNNMESSEPPTRQQAYELGRMHKRMRKNAIPLRVWHCRWQAEVFLLMHGRGTVK